MFTLNLALEFLKKKYLEKSFSGINKEVLELAGTIDRNLSLELLRVTEVAAMAAASLVGRGDKNKADGAAVYAMRVALAAVAMDGTVIIGEGEKDQAPMLYTGEKIGNGEPPEVDIEA